MTEYWKPCSGPINWSKLTSPITAIVDHDGMLIALLPTTGGMLRDFKIMHLVALSPELLSAAEKLLERIRGADFAMVRGSTDSSGSCGQKVFHPTAEVDELSRVIGRIKDSSPPPRPDAQITSPIPEQVVIDLETLVWLIKGTDYITAIRLVRVALNCELHEAKSVVARIKHEPGSP